MDPQPHPATFDLDSLDHAESDRVEFKSSQTAPKDLKLKLQKAASAFWNSGGGYFVAGVDDKGVADGGVPLTIGRTPLRDWVDQVLHEIAPTGPYRVHLTEGSAREGAAITNGRAVLAVEFQSSAAAPHMALDHRYYIRAGAHTAPAPGFIVEALWHRRANVEPDIVHVLRFKPDDHDVIQLGIVSTTAGQAFDVEITIEPTPRIWGVPSSRFPLRISMVDREHPFYLDLTTFAMAEERLGDGASLTVRYRNRASSTFLYQQHLNVLEAMGPMRLGGGHDKKLAQHLESISKSLKKVDKVVEHLEQLATITGPSGIRVSHAALRDLRYAIGSEPTPALLDATAYKWRVFVEVLGVDHSTATALERHFRHGYPDSLAEVAGMSPELRERLRGSFFSPYEEI